MKKFFLFLLAIFSVISLMAHPKFSTRITREDFYQNRADSAHGFDVTHYDINLKINPSTQLVNGFVEAQVTAQQNLSQIQYELISLIVDSVKVNNNLTTFTYQNGIITINLNVQNGQNFTTRVYYQGHPVLSNDGYGNGMTFLTSQVFTVSDPNASRYWWPCYDHPWDKAIVNLHIRTRSDWKVACNGLRTQIEDHGDGTSTHHWIGSNPMATYLVSLAATNYAEITGEYAGTPIQNFVLPSHLSTATLLFADLPQMMQAYTEAFGPYPFEKYGNAVANISTFAAMEHQTMTTMGASFIQNNDMCKYIVTHELAHQWFGNCLTPLTWKDVWLSESFATYSEAVYAQFKYGYDNMTNYVKTSFHDYYRNWANSNGDQTIYDPAYLDYFTPPEYEKGASVLHMLRLKVGNEIFFNILRTYFNTYHNSNVVTSEFKQVCEQISGQNLTQFFNQWIFNYGLPSFEYAVFLNENKTNAKIYIKSFTSHSTNPFEVNIPVNFIQENNQQDSVVVLATPEPNGFFEKQFANPVSSYGLDTKNWILCVSKTELVPILNSVLATNNQCLLQWSEINLGDIEELYNIYRCNQQNGTYVRINDTPVNQTHFTDATAINDQTYYYKIKAVIDGFESTDSNIIAASPVFFPLNQGILVVDETRDNNGTVMNPTDTMVDDFYSSVINEDFTSWDVASQGLPGVEIIKNYSMVIWHDDDLNMSMIDENMNVIFGQYALAGGKLLISGFKTSDRINDIFMTTFTGAQQKQMIGSPIFDYAEGTNIGDMHLREDLIIPNWNGNLSYIYTYPNAPNALYKTVLTQDNELNHVPCMIYGDHVIISGMPLYYFQESEVTTFFDRLLSDWPSETSDPNTIPVTLSMKMYPNPVSGNTVNVNIKSISKIQKATIYNIKGQKVTEILFDPAKKEQTVVWNKKDDQNRSVSSGLYFIRLSNATQSKTGKILILK